MMISVTTKKRGCSYGIFCVMECYDATCEQAKVLSPKHHRYRGFALVWTALVFFAIFLLVGLSLDYAKLFYNSHQLQNAADAAALAGAQIVTVSTANETRQLTHNLGYANKAEKLEVTLEMKAQSVDPFEEDPDLEIILGRWINHQRRFFETLNTPDAVKVIARRAGLTEYAPPLAMLFGPLVGVDTANARREAIGWYSEISGAGLIVLDTEPKNKQDKPRQGLYIASNGGEISVVGGSIHVNIIYEGEKSSAAVYLPSGGTMLSSRLSVTGHTDPAPGLSDWERIWTDDFGMEVPYDIFEGAEYMPDPLGPEGYNIQPPTIPTNADGTYDVKSYVTNTSVTLDPGYYPDGIAITKEGISVTLNPGTYIIGGGNLPGNTLAGLTQVGGTLTGHGVLIYLTKDYGETDIESDDGNWAQLDIGGNVVTDITPPGDYMTPRVINGKPGVSIWQDRENIAFPENQAQLHGGAGMNISGTLYFPNNHLYLAGIPGKTGNQILCGTVEVFGTAKILVEYDGRNDQNKGTSVLVK